MPRALRYLIPLAAGLAVFRYTLPGAGLPPIGADPLLDLVALQDPGFYSLIRAWHLLAPALTTLSLAAVLVNSIASLAQLATDLHARYLDRLAAAAAAAAHLLTWRFVAATLAAIFALVWSAYARPFPLPGADPLLDLIAIQDPGFYLLIRVWHLVVPSVLAFGGLLTATSASRLWLESLSRRNRAERGNLPPWPTSPTDESPSLVVGELHHPVEARESAHPRWLTIPERGLYTGVAIFGAVGSGKTAACMRPFADQLLSWNADDSARRAAALVLEVKGDFCYQIRDVLEATGRKNDYIELALGGRWQWNPLSSTMDSYSLAYTVGALLNQLFGKSKEPFWQAAYINLIRWLIELHRALPEQWVTFQDLYACAINSDLIAHKLARAQAIAAPPDNPPYIYVPVTAVTQHARHAIAALPWQPTGGDEARLPATDELLDTLASLSVPTSVRTDERPLSEHAARVAAIQRWYDNDWLQLDTKLRTSIVESISVFLSHFDLPEVARSFCPPPPQPPPARPHDLPPPPPGALPSSGPALLQPLPPIERMIEDGRVIALNMPAGSNAALARTIGVLLKNAWLQSLLTRPSRMQAQPRRYFRPAVFICDEYQSFATVGEDDPSGDEKAFALTRQCRVIPIVATQSIASLKSVLSGQEAWRTLLQTLRTHIFLSLSDDSSAQHASTVCGKVVRLSPSYSITESARPAFSLITARATGAKGTLGTSKSYREQREPLFHPRSFSLLENFQAIVLPFDGTKSTSATRVYLKPHFLPRHLPYWRAKEAGQL